MENKQKKCQDIDCEYIKVENEKKLYFKMIIKILLAVIIIALVFMAGYFYSSYNKFDEVRDVFVTKDEFLSSLQRENVSTNATIKYTDNKGNVNYLNIEALDEYYSYSGEYNGAKFSDVGVENKEAKKIISNKALKVDEYMLDLQGYSWFENDLYYNQLDGIAYYTNSKNQFGVVTKGLNNPAEKEDDEYFYITRKVTDKTGEYNYKIKNEDGLFEIKIEYTEVK